MSSMLDVDLKETVLSGTSFGPHEVEQISIAISEDYTRFAALRDAVGELDAVEERSPAAQVRLGVCQYLLGRHGQALSALASGDGGALALFYSGKAHLALRQFDRAVEAFNAANSAGYDGDTCTLAVAEAQRYAGDAETAMKTLDGMFGPVEQTAEYLYQRGATVAAIGGNPLEMVALYERAITIDGNHAGALFGLAMENDRRGNDDEALSMYRRAAARFPAHVGSLLNLGIMYEDMEQFNRAQQCYQRVLDSHPSNDRARLFLRDAQASSDMYYDEEAQKKRDRLSQVLAIPVTDFELSVRSRNCLQKMGIHSLGDLTRCSEAELLASKNFGETSLVEIREMLVSKGLELGQFAHEKVEPEPVYDTSSLSPDQQALLDRPIAELNLSVRARKCMVRLEVTSIGELARKSQDELLECKNFGVTSLNEVREKLGHFSLKLRGE